MGNFFLESRKKELAIYVFKQRTIYK